MPPKPPKAAEPAESKAKPAPAKAPTAKAPANLADLFLRPHIRAFFKKHADEANRVLRTGPGGGGWRHNESKRQEAEEFAAVLNYLSNGIEATAAEKVED